MTNVSIECNRLSNIVKLTLLSNCNFTFLHCWNKFGSWGKYTPLFKHQDRFVKVLLAMYFVCLIRDGCRVHCYVSPDLQVLSNGPVVTRFGSGLLFGSLCSAEMGDWLEHKGPCIGDVRRAASNSPCPPRQPWLWFGASSKTTCCLGKWVT